MAIPKKLAEDVERLQATLGLDVEVLENGSQLFVIVKRASLPVGTYSKPASDVLLLTDVQYSVSAMDMFWMEPDVTLANGSIPPHMSAIESYAGKNWRRWSWHRNGKWVPGVDDIFSQWEVVQACWERESQG